MTSSQGMARNRRAAINSGNGLETASIWSLGRLPEFNITSQTTALTLGPEPVFMTADGSVHGPDCYDHNGRLTCAWPEQHDDRFVIEALPFPQDQPAVVARSTSLDLVGGLQSEEKLDGQVLDVRRSSRRSRLVTGLVLAAAVAVATIGITFRVADLHVQTVISGSMRPTISPGDMAVTQAVPVGSLRAGDAIVFYPPGQTLAVLHRITSLNTTATGMAITTRGDANSVDDPWHVTLQGTTAYRMVAVVPFVGWLTELQRPALLVAGLLLGLAILLELWKEVKARGKKSQS